MRKALNVKQQSTPTPRKVLNQLQSGIPWGFSYQGLEATNTCAMDTALMTWFLLQKYCGATLPESEMSTRPGKLLQQAVMDISNRQYDRARYHWSTELMGYPAAGMHGDFYSMEHAFLGHLHYLVESSSMH
ncbi:hypothetical protein BG006_003127 [Podila minutissima]|uniref:Uncharacterized protein n=1 Tax=Podila minutissima TaxID=64525 RepID=A0A9P5S9C3_9FUNG|nr:hypothetical protein BG006_003127 [Podila minutissima]